MWKVLRASLISRTIQQTSFFASKSMSAVTLRTPSEVLTYWFGNARKGELHDIKQRLPYWFSSNYPEFVQTQMDNANLIDEILQDRLNTGEWDSNENPEALMAKVIILDQFCRSVHRGTALAFQGDNYASSLVQSVVEKGWYPSRFSAVERMFLCLNLHHTEDVNLHNFAQSQMVPYMADGTVDDVASFFNGINKSFFQDHYDVVKQFGRYPHRNILLGRESTPEEVEWLNSPSLPNWAKSQLPSSSSS